MVTSVRKPSQPRFWRDATLPFIEARSVCDGRMVRYAKHAHETFSIGIVTSGSCTYSNGKTREHIGAGSVVVMNPGDAHACNPRHDELWAYRMLYVEIPWLIGIQQDVGISRNQHFRPILTTATTQPRLYAGLYRLYDILTDEQTECLQKHSAAVAFMAAAQQALNPAPDLPRYGPRGLVRAAEFIRDNYARSLELDEICSAADLSRSYLIRAFKGKYGLTPHAYLTNCRIEFCRSQLRRGRPIAEVALAAGFSDQAHLQRSFKKIVAATPGEYRACVP
jgi:AraC-like DNA-binding protein